jgi:hypothetical protein
MAMARHNSRRFIMDGRPSKCFIGGRNFKRAGAISECDMGNFRRHNRRDIQFQIAGL